MVTKIISGGQTGADQGGLFAARDACIETGGFAPKGFLTEAGQQPGLLKSFGLVDSGLDYVGRTELNVKNSDTTIWFGRIGSPGYRATHRAAVSSGKTVYIASELEHLDLVSILEEHDIINIAGNRESKNPGICEITRVWLLATLRKTRSKR